MQDNNQNKENLNNQSQNAQNTTTYVDPRTVQAEIIGELRKDKIGKPVLVIEMFLLFGIVLVSLPFINSMMQDENSTLYRLIHKNEITSTETPGTGGGSSGIAGASNYLDGSKDQQLTSTTQLKFDNVLIRNFTLITGGINANISSYTGTINLDEDSIYLQIVTANGNNIASVKLTGKYDTTPVNVNLMSSELSFNKNFSYQGKLVRMKDDDYPDDKNYQENAEDGLGKLVCKLDNRTITYNFQNKFLTSIEDNVTVIREKINTTTTLAVVPERNSNQTTQAQSTTVATQKTYTQDELYKNLLEKLSKKSEILGPNISSTVENDNGFVFNAKIDLTQEGYTIPSSIKDYDYYPLETQEKKIKYAETGKGFECK